MWRRVVFFCVIISAPLQLAYFCNPLLAYVIVNVNQSVQVTHTRYTFSLVYFSLRGCSKVTWPLAQLGNSAGVRGGGDWNKKKNRKFCSFVTRFSGSDFTWELRDSNSFFFSFLPSHFLTFVFFAFFFICFGLNCCSPVSDEWEINEHERKKKRRKRMRSKVARIVLQLLLQYFHSTTLFGLLHDREQETNENEDEFIYTAVTDRRVRVVSCFVYVRACTFGFIRHEVLPLPHWAEQDRGLIEARQQKKNDFMIHFLSSSCSCSAYIVLSGRVMWPFTSPEFQNSKKTFSNRYSIKCSIHTWAVLIQQQQHTCSIEGELGPTPKILKKKTNQGRGHDKSRTGNRLRDLWPIRRSSERAVVCRLPLVPFDFGAIGNFQCFLLFCFLNVLQRWSLRQSFAIRQTNNPTSAFSLLFRLSRHDRLWIGSCAILHARPADVWRKKEIN